MKNKKKTDKQLGDEIKILKDQVKKLEKSPSDCKNETQAMLKIRDKFQDFFDNAPVGYHSFGPDRIIYEINKAELDMIGFSRGEIVGKKTWADLILPEQKPIFERHWKQINKTGSVRNIEYTLLHKNGGHIDVLLSATMLYDQKGKSVRTRGIVVDITELKRIETELQTERNKLNSILESAQDGLSIQNLDYDIIYQNNILRDVFGHLGDKCYRVYESKDKVCIGCPVKLAFKDGKSHMSERKILMPTGEITYWENMASPIKDAQGKIVSCLEVARNVTVRKRAEEALKKSESILKKQKKALEEKTIALTEVIAQIETEKDKIKKDIVTNVNELIMPTLKKIKMKGASKKYVNLLSRDIKELVSPFGRKITDSRVKLAPREIEICDMVKNGLTSKEIASLLNISLRTVEKHRLSSRKKLGLAKKGFNLTSFLQSL